jgi:hypothetical protein
LEPNKRFIIKPYFFTNENELDKNPFHYTDVLTYVGIKSFDNLKGNCFPSQETIAETIGTSKKFVIPSVERLEASGYLEVYRSKIIRVVNRYFFPEPKSFQKIPYEVLKCNDLNHNEKAMLLLVRELSLTPHDLIGTRTELALRLGMGYSMFNTQFEKLIAKGYIMQEGKSRFRLLRIDWHIPDIEKQPDKNKYIFVLG